jgi:FkbM family methyltransferase
LIEAEPNNFKSTVEKHRNAVLVPACLSLSTKPKVSAFEVGKKMQGKIVESNNLQGSVNVQCLPLYSILLAVNRTTVDVFSLDIEGNELDVLKTIPFDKVDIKVRNANVLI